MGEILKFDYYYGIEAEQFSFYRIPRILIKDERFKKLSSDAKLLYGLMIDRMAMSMKNGWLDDVNRAYIIYTIDSIMDDLCCGKEKAVKVLAELDANKGIGLIEKIRRGLGKPDIIYVKNFVGVEKRDDSHDDKKPANAHEITEVGKSDFKKSEKPTSRGQENRLQEVGETDSKRSENQTSRSLETGLQEVGNTDPNYNNTNYNNLSYNNPINQSGAEAQPEQSDRIDGTDEVTTYMELIRKNIEYEHHMQYDDWCNKGLYQELYDVICEVVCVKRKTVRIAREDYPYELVKSKFLKLNDSHLEYVIGCMKDTTNKIGNIKSYMVTALYNAPSTMNHYYQQEVQHDIYWGRME